MPIAAEAQTGFASAAAYDAHRPTYPAKALSDLLAHLDVAGVKGAKVMDLAAGTGKFTELLSAREEGYEILAIEPHEGMRSQLSKKNLRGVRVLDGTAENMRAVNNGEVAAVVASQAFHWFADMNALKEIYRVLAPTGVLGMIWNIEDYNSPKSWDITPGWESTIRDLTWTFDDNQPRFRHEKWRAVFDEQTRSDPLTLHFAEPMFSLPLGEDSVPFETWLSKEDMWKRYRTLSQVAILQGEELKRVHKEFSKAIDTAEEKDGKIAVHGRTFFAWTSRIPGDPLRCGG